MATIFSGCAEFFDVLSFNPLKSKSNRKIIVADATVSKQIVINFTEGRYTSLSHATYDSIAIKNSDCVRLSFFGSGQIQTRDVRPVKKTDEYSDFESFSIDILKDLQIRGFFPNNVLHITKILTFLKIFRETLGVGENSFAYGIIPMIGSGSFLFPDSILIDVTISKENFTFFVESKSAVIYFLKSFSAESVYLGKNGFFTMNSEVFRTSLKFDLSSIDYQSFKNILLFEELRKGLKKRLLLGEVSSINKLRHSHIVSILKEKYL